MSARRALGELESEVLSTLWKAEHPLTPAEVLTMVDAELAYTTVMTVLGRLWSKGLADRSKKGRAFAYSAAVSEADFSAERMIKALDTSENTLATMSQFVNGLDRRQQRQLLKLLEEREK